MERRFSRATALGEIFQAWQSDAGNPCGMKTLRERGLGVSEGTVSQWLKRGREGQCIAPLQFVSLLPCFATQQRFRH